MTWRPFIIWGWVIILTLINHAHWCTQCQNMTPIYHPWRGCSGESSFSGGEGPASWRLSIIWWWVVSHLQTPINHAHWCSQCQNMTTIYHPRMSYVIIQLIIIQIDVHLWYNILFDLVIIYLKCCITCVYCVNIYTCTYRRHILMHKDGPCNEMVNMPSATAAAAAAATTVAATAAVASAATIAASGGETAASAGAETAATASWCQSIICGWIISLAQFIFSDDMLVISFHNGADAYLYFESTNDKAGISVMMLNYDDISLNSVIYWRYVSIDAQLNTLTHIYQRICLSNTVNARNIHILKVVMQYF